MDSGGGRYNLDDLADLAGVSRRTVRYYIQEGLLPAPLGVGRGRHYNQAHLDRLLQVRAQQEAGRSLVEIKEAEARPAEGQRERLRTPRPLPRSVWRRVTLGPGIELHLANDITLPAGSRLDELAAWCRLHVTRTEEGEE